MNTLYYGDNLNILRRYIKDESVDLIYLDPPFNSNRNYNVLFKDESGAEADSQIMAFEDTWHWAGAARTYNELILEGDKVAEMLQAFYGFIGTNQMMAYLVMMAVRLKELHRVLKPTGSLYLHCDPSASHYLKILLDTIFGPGGLKSEIIWKRTTARSDTGQSTMSSSSTLRLTTISLGTRSTKTTTKVISNRSTGLWTRRPDNSTG
jgi:site-specific DNA-methyltransferase (adenine-specific)